MNDIKVDFHKIKLPLITDEEIKLIDNNLDSITNEFIKIAIKDKDLYIAQYIIKKQSEDKDNLIKYLEDKIKEYENNFDVKKALKQIEINTAVRIAYQDILERIKK